jgi:hypothetical protein
VCVCVCVFIYLLYVLLCFVIKIVLSKIDGLPRVGTIFAQGIIRGIIFTYLCYFHISLCLFFILLYVSVLPYCDSTS